MTGWLCQSSTPHRKRQEIWRQMRRGHQQVRGNLLTEHLRQGFVSLMTCLDVLLLLRLFADSALTHPQNFSSSVTCAWQQALTMPSWQITGPKEVPEQQVCASLDDVRKFLSCRQLLLRALPLVISLELGKAVIGACAAAKAEGSPFK